MTCSAPPDLAAVLRSLGGAWAGRAEDLDPACRRRDRTATLSDLFLSIRDLPSNRPKHGSPPEAVIAEWRGTCSGKHIMLRHALTARGIPVPADWRAGRDGAFW